MGGLLKLLALGRAARMGPLGLGLAAYGVWRRLSPESRDRVLQRAESMVRKARAKTAVETQTHPPEWR